LGGCRFAARLLSTSDTGGPLDLSASGLSDMFSVIGQAVRIDGMGSNGTAA